MTCQNYQDLMMGYLDDELSSEQRRTFEEHLESCEGCRSEFEQFKKLKRITDSVQLAEPEDEMWQKYWGGVYNRFERGIGWILMSVAGIALLIYGGFKAVEAIVKDPTVGLMLKIGILAFIGGVAILFVSILRERLYFWKRDRYKDVQK